MKLSAIWLASSRVGDSTSTRQPRFGACFRLASSRCRIGSANAARLAGAGLGDALNVAAQHYMRDRLRLDRGGNGVTDRVERGQEGLGQAEVLEGGHESIFFHQANGGVEIARTHRDQQGREPARTFEMPSPRTRSQVKPRDADMLPHCSKVKESMRI